MKKIGSAKFHIINFATTIQVLVTYRNYWFDKMNGLFKSVTYEPFT